jgi:hypothetical protein
LKKTADGNKGNTKDKIYTRVKRRSKKKDIRNSNPYVNETDIVKEYVPWINVSNNTTGLSKE